MLLFNLSFHSDSITLFELKKERKAKSKRLKERKKVILTEIAHLKRKRRLWEEDKVN